jgi:hypothetical protein
VGRLKRYFSASEAGIRDMGVLNGCEGYWKLEDTGWADESLNGYDLTAIDVPAIVTAKVDNGAQFASFPASGLHIADASAPNLDFSGPFSVALWAKNPSGWAECYFVGKGDSGTANSWGFMQFGGQFGAWIRDGAGHSNAYQYGGTPQTDTWQCLYLIFDESYMDIYVDNSRTLHSAWTYPPGDGAQDFFVGGNGSLPSIDGVIDEVAVWSRAITSDERDYYYNAGAGRHLP